MNAFLTAMADLDEADLEEVMLYAQFRKCGIECEEGARTRCDRGCVA
jgi:hypothetical protein